MFGTLPCTLLLSGEPNGDPQEYTQFGHLCGKNDHRRPIGAPQGDFGQRGSGANNLPPGPFIFSGPPPLVEVARKRKNLLTDMWPCVAPPEESPGLCDQTRAPNPTARLVSLPAKKEAVASLPRALSRGTTQNPGRVCGYVAPPRPGPDPPPYQNGGHCGGDAVCSACVLRSLGQSGAGTAA
jgi:hypothetical protein